MKLEKRFNKTSKKLKSFALRNTHALVVVAVAVVGVAALASSQAASNPISVQPESGTKSANIATITDPSASGGAAIQFKAGTTVPPSSNFTISGGKIYDPEGKEFIPIGANVNGPNSWWSSQTAGRASIAKDRWHWSAIRLSTCLTGGCPEAGAYWTTNNDLDAIVNDYTSKKIAVIIAIHNFTGGIPTGSDLTNVTNFWTTTATKYKNNPYVWFNLLNEPSGDPSITQWYNTHDSIGTAIRATGAQNMIVADASNWGQDFQLGYECPATYSTATASQSAVLTRGQELMNKLGNVSFSIHIYAWWGGANCAASRRDSYVDTYMGLAKQKGLPIMIGELQGVTNRALEPSYQAGQSEGALAFFRRAPTHRYGMQYWHGSAGSTQTSGLLANDSDWFNINATGTNLSEWGTALRNYSLSINP